MMHHISIHKIGVAAVAGVFLLLGLGMVMGVVILIFEHWFYKYALPSLRLKPKGTIWKSRNIMFFSQKLYRFINCVELVSPHHAARELVHSIRQGQIASLFQKSIKRVRIRFWLVILNYAQSIGMSTSRDFDSFFASKPHALCLSLSPTYLYRPLSYCHS